MAAGATVGALAAASPHRQQGTHIARYREFLPVGGDVAGGGVRARVAAQRHIRIVFVLVHTHMTDFELRREGLAEARIEAALARLGLAVVLVASGRRVREAPGCRHSSV